MPKSLRTYLADLERELPDDLVRVDKEIDPEFEVTGILQKLEDKGQLPAVLFENVRNLKGEPGHRQLMNLVASRKRIALGLGLSPSQYRNEVTERIASAGNKPMPTKTIDKADAPVREVVLTGSAVDLADYPIVTQAAMDGGPFFTMNMINVDPETGVYNGSFQRLMYRGKPAETGTCMAPFDTWTIYQKYRARGSDTPFAYVLGHHPAFELAMGMRLPLSTSEYEVASALLGEPLRVVPSETFGTDLMVPADAEMIIEGYVLAEGQKAEGPFGEWSGYYSGMRQSEFTRLTAITRRHDPIIRTVWGGHREHTSFGGWEGEMYRRAKDAVPGVQAVHIAQSSAGMHMYMSMTKRVDGDPKAAALAAASVGFVKLIIVVDDDIDVFQEEQVLWAVAVRFQAHDIDIIRALKGSIIDPSNVHPTQHSLAIIDATEPKSRAFPTRLKVPDEVMKRLDLDEYVKPRAKAKQPVRA